MNAGLKRRIRARAGSSGALALAQSAARATVVAMREDGGDEAPATLRFERRSATRFPAIGRLDAVRSDGMTFPTTLRLQLVDESIGGLAARTDMPLAPGAQLSVRTSPETDAWRHGVVLRCVPTGDGYRLAIAYARRKAA